MRKIFTSSDNFPWHGKQRRSLANFLTCRDRRGWVTGKEKAKKKKNVQEKESLLSKSMNHSPKMKPSHLGLLLIPLIKRLGVCRGQGEARPPDTSKLHETHACVRSYPTDTHTNIQLTLKRACKWCACHAVGATFVPTVF